ncbi:MAG: molecular chaperone DjiA, partial [Rhodobacteraceae bacterium]|nr:molecular chaperone DjiA [Paracoccaceae bacterium]
KGESLTQVFERLSTPPERRTAFAIAVIALGAKMAKADGQVTRDEVTAFREIFYIPREAEAQAARVFDYARQDVTGFEAYARSIARMFGRNKTALEDLLEGLFFIAMADGEYHPKEDDFIHRVSGIFGISEKRFRILRSRFAPNAPRDAYQVLGVDPDTPLDDIRKAWKRAVRETHPDRMIARGVPEEAVTLATRKLVAVNRAWQEISQGRA